MGDAAVVGGVMGAGIGVVLVIIVGGLIGWLASVLMKATAQMGLIANVLGGIAGAWLGGFIAARLGLTTGALGGLVTAIAGAALVIAGLRVVRCLPGDGPRDARMTVRLLGYVASVAAVLYVGLAAVLAGYVLFGFGDDPLAAAPLILLGLPWSAAMRFAGDSTPVAVTILTLALGLNAGILYTIARWPGGLR